MEFRDLKSQYLNNKTAIDNAIQNVLLDGNFIGGAAVSQLEEVLAKYVGVKYCITCGNGTDALQLALMAWEIGKGDAVFVPDFTFFSSGEVVCAVGAEPVFVDIEADTYNISAESLEKAVQYVLKKTDLQPKAVVAVDLFGQPADFERVRTVANKYGLLILEDGAQGFGGKIGRKRAGSFGDISTTSFFPAKPLGCYGDGGAVFTDNNDWAELIRSYKVHGKGKDKYDNVRIGMNSRLDAMQAAVLLEKMELFDEEIDRCNKIAEEYTERLKDVVKVPVIREGMTSSWAQYTVCFKSNEERVRAIEALNMINVPTAVYYRKPMHMQAAFEKNRMDELDYTVTEGICERCLSLPMHGYLTSSEVCCIADRLVQAVMVND